MKKTLLTTLMAVAVAGSSMAQGIVTFSASTVSARPVRYSLDGTTLINIPAGASNNVPGFGSINVTAYAASSGTALTLNPDGTPNFTGWVIAQSAPDHTVAPSAGNMAAYNMTMDASLGGAGTAVQMEIVGWTGAFGSFTAAAQGGALVGWSGSTLSGGSLSWAQATGTTSSPVVQLTGVGGFSGLVLTTIPEPGTMLLGGLGAAALLLFRRRK